jgi:hypothetical protein
VVIHSAKYKRAPQSESTFISFIDLEVRCSRAVRSVLGFGSVAAIIKVDHPGEQGKIMLLVDRWTVDHPTFGNGSANDIVGAGLQYCVPVFKAGGLLLLHVRHLLARVVFTRSSSNQFRGHVLPEWVAGPFCNVWEEF